MLECALTRVHESKLEHARTYLRVFTTIYAYSKEHDNHPVRRRMYNVIRIVVCI